MTTRHVLVLSLKRDALTENKKLSSRVYNINVYQVGFIFCERRVYLYE